MEQTQDKKVYRIQGLTCTNCAKQFEKNVCNLPGVRKAKVNFGASKITVYGEATIDEIEKAGAFENLKITPENQVYSSGPFWRQKEYLLIFLSSFLLFTAWIIDSLWEERNLFIIALYIGSILVGGYRLFFYGLKSLFRLQFQMNTLMTIAIFGAMAIGEWTEGAIVVILFAISERLEAYSMDKARRSIRSLMDIAPKQAIIRRNEKEQLVDVDDIQVNDIMIVKPGQKIAMDGIIIKGSSTVNQAAITGESIPIFKTVHDQVYAGTLNEEGLIEVRVTKKVEDTTLSKIIHLVEEAQAKQAPSQSFIDRFAQIYTPVILVIGILTALIPPFFFNGNWYEWIYRGLALLVVGCPCALVISTPVSIVTAIGNAARNGVLIKGGIHLEETASLKAIAFDKTGTLTQGKPIVTDFISFEKGKEKEHLAIAAAIEKNAQHPLATAIVNKAKEENIDFMHVSIESFTSITGKGVTAQLNHQKYLIGSPVLFKELLTPKIHEQIEKMQKQGKTVMLLGTNEKILSIFAVMDQTRKEAHQVIQQLHKLGLKNIILTGDNQTTADAIGKQVGITEIKAHLLPKDKMEYVKRLKNDVGHVAMVGDGVNDAPALAEANVGIAMGGAGSDTALETADIVLMADDLKKLPFTIRLSQKALQIIKQNVIFSLSIKALALLLIIPGWLNLWMAIFADMGATLLVTLNGLRLLKVRE